jgi:type I restriction enzyme S subunit
VEVRYGYKHTEVGVIPKDWQVKPLKEISPAQSVGLVVNPSTYFDERGTVPMLLGSNISANRIDWESAQRITEASNKLIPASVLAAGDLVTVRVGDPGITAVVPRELDGCNCASVMIVRRHHTFDSRWLCYLMNSNTGLEQVKHVQYGTAQKQFNISDAVNFLFPVPLFAEQKAIADALSDADALIESLEQLLVKKRQIKQGAMQELLTGRKRLPGFSGEWELKRLGQISKSSSGGTPPTSVAAYYDGEIPWVSISDMTKGGKVISATEQNLTTAGLTSSAAQMFPSGTVLYAMYASIGECSVAGVPLCSSQAILGIRPNESLSSEFLYYFLTSLKSVVKAMGQQGTQANLNAGIVRGFELRLPPLPEQTAIAAILSDMDAELAVLDAKLVKARQIKLGMMQELLTGRIRLR